MSAVDTDGKPVTGSERAEEIDIQMDGAACKIDEVRGDQLADQADS